MLMVCVLIINHISIVFCEAVAIFGVIASLLAAIKMNSYSVPDSEQLSYNVRIFPSTFPHPLPVPLCWLVYFLWWNHHCTL